MSSQDIKERLLFANNLAKEEIIAIKENPQAGISYIAEHIKSYIAYKLLLDKTSFSDNINEMIQDNVAKSLNVDKEKLKKVDQPSKCNGTTAVTSKRVLLFLSIQKELEIQLPVEKIPEIESVVDLAKLIYALMNTV